MNRPAIPDLNRKNKFLLAAVLIVCLLIPILFWRSVWFGRPLTPEQIQERLEGPATAREIQHALVLVEGMIRAQDSEANNYYAAISRLSNHEREEIRTMVAWVMGQDRKSALFHQTLHGMLNDSHPMVRRNAALGLVRFQDPAALPVLRSMLEPHPILAPAEGTIQPLVRRGEWVSSNTAVARFVNSAAELTLLAQLPTRISEIRVEAGEGVQAGQVLILLAPPPDHVWEALRALYVMGEAEDLERVRPYAEDSSYSEEIRRQARLTARKLEQRVTGES